MHPENWPRPGAIHLVDDTEVDQSNWKNGALHTRVLDPDVDPESYRVSWPNIPSVAVAGIEAHYAAYATGSGGVRVFAFERSPGVFVDVFWSAPPSIRRFSAKFANVEAVLTHARANDKKVPPIFTAPRFIDGRTITFENGLTMTCIGVPTLPILP